MKNTIFGKIKELREEKKLLIREVASATHIDQSLLSKFENGERLPTKQQLLSLISFYEADYNEMLILWLSDKLLSVIDEEEDLLINAFQVAEEKVKYRRISKSEILDIYQDKLSTIDSLLQQLQGLRETDSYRIVEALDLEYTCESNRIEGSTLTIKETDLVIIEGLTISGKTMREHLEAINHHEAILYIKDIIRNKLQLNERTLLDIHSIILRNIDRENAGRYRMVQVYIKGSKHIPPQPYMVQKEMEDYFIWYEKNKNRLHPVLLAAEMHERLVSIHPFIDGNGRTARLVMNLILLKSGYVIANIKGDAENRLKYYECLEKVQVFGEKKDFINFILDTEKSCLERYIEILRKQ